MKDGLKPLACALAFVACGSMALAVGVGSWSASTAEEFDRGTLDGTALDHDGRIRLAPELTPLWGPAEGIVWQVAPAGSQSAFVALSSPGRVLRVSAGDEQVLWEAEGESLVTALAADGAGGVYFGVSPEGRILHVDAQGDVATLFQAPATFIWSLAVDEGGDIWVGTGTPGHLIRLGANGQARPVFSTEDDPVRCLASLPGGGVLLGTGGRGRVVRVDDQERAFVLYDADEPEIVSVLATEDGTVYALAAQRSKEPRSARSGNTSSTAAPGGSMRVVVRPTAPQGHGESEPQTTETSAKPTTGFKGYPGGGVYRIENSGRVSKIWTATNEMPFALGRDAEGHLLVATGDRGRIWILDRDGSAARLLRIASDQVSALAAAESGRIVVGGSTDASVSLLEPEPRSSGAYLTQAVDAGTVAEWGRLRFDVDLPQGTKIALQARSGNTAEPDDTWSLWTSLSSSAGSVGVETGVPSARFFQARFDLASKRRGTPALSVIEVFYLPHNQRPSVAELTVHPPGLVLVKAPVQTSSAMKPVVADDPVARKTAASLTRTKRSQQPRRQSYEAGARTFSWQAEDPDGDRLLYVLEIRREGTEYWFPLADTIDRRFYSWDARSMSNGLYRIRLTASDAVDNPDGKHLSGHRVSDAFTIDNTRPKVGALEVREAEGGLEVGFVASDVGGNIAAVEFAVDGSKWQPLHPVDGVADSEEEQYRMLVENGVDESRASRALMVRVTDAAGNLGGEMWLLDSSGEVSGRRSDPTRP